MGKIAGAQAVVASLEAEGVECVFGYPGAQAMQIFDALFDSDIRFVLARHEQGAVHEADGYARASGKPGVVLVTSGPGATNTVTGIACAYMDSIPLVVITAQVPTSVIGTDSFQESDTFGITLPIVKHSYLLRDAADIPKTFKKAFQIASTGRPGPVLIDIPSDVAASMLNFSYPAEVDIASYKPTVKGNQKQVRLAVARLSQAQRPLIIAGGGVVSAGATEELVCIAHMLRIPVATTLMGKGAFPSSDELCLGAIGMHGSKATTHAVENCDVLLAVGTHFSDRVTGDAATFAQQAVLIHIDIDPAEIGKIFQAHVPIVGDAKSVLGDIAAGLEKRDAKPSDGAWCDRISEWKSAWPLYEAERVQEHVEGKAGTGKRARAAGAAGAAGAGAAHAADAADRARAQAASALPGIDPQMLIAELSKHLSDETIVTTDVGQHQMWANQLLARQRPRTFLSSGGLGVMGYGLPAAIGASLACPQVPVVCISGDGSIQMNMQEMATAVAIGAPVKVVVLDNGVLGMVRQWQDLFCEKRFFATTLECNPDFVALAKAFGWEAAQLEDAGAVDEAIEAMLASTGPYLLNCKIAPQHNVFPMVSPGGGISDVIEADDVHAVPAQSGRKGDVR